MKNMVIVTKPGSRVTQRPMTWWQQCAFQRSSRSAMGTLMGLARLQPKAAHTEEIRRAVRRELTLRLPYCMLHEHLHRTPFRSSSEHHFSINLLSYDEDEVSIKFRTSTPIKAPISGKYLLLADSLFSLSKAANSIKLNDLESTLRYLYEATSKVPQS